MIAARPIAFARLSARLATKARQIARAWALSKRHAARADSRHWRRPELLWPTFSEDL